MRTTLDRFIVICWPCRAIWSHRSLRQAQIKADTHALTRHRHRRRDPLAVGIEVLAIAELQNGGIADANTGPD